MLANDSKANTQILERGWGVKCNCFNLCHVITICTLMFDVQRCVYRLAGASFSKSSYYNYIWCLNSSAINHYYLATFACLWAGSVIIVRNWLTTILLSISLVATLNKLNSNYYCCRYSFLVNLNFKKSWLALLFNINTLLSINDWMLVLSTFSL